MESKKEQIVKWIAQRIIDEQRKHGKFNNRWQEIAARKIFASYTIKLKTDNLEDCCEYCGVIECQGSCEYPVDDLTNEKTFTKFLNTLCCNQCSWFKGKKCTEEKAEKHESDKVNLKAAYDKSFEDGWNKTPELVSDARREMLNGFKIRASDIDEYFVCTKYNQNNNTTTWS